MTLEELNDILAKDENLGSLSEVMDNNQAEVTELFETGSVQLVLGEMVVTLVLQVHRNE